MRRLQLCCQDLLTVHLLDAIIEAGVIGHVELAHMVHEHLLANKVTKLNLNKVKLSAAASQTGITNLSKEVQRLLDKANLTRQTPTPNFEPEDDDDISGQRWRNGRRN